MQITGKVHLFFEQSGTFKNQFKKLGYEAYDYDIQNHFGETDHVIDLFSEIDKAYNNLTEQNRTEQNRTEQNRTEQYSTLSTLVKTLLLRSTPVFTFVQLLRCSFTWLTEIIENLLPSRKSKRFLLARITERSILTG
jgi:hypothetical protein